MTRALKGLNKRTVDTAAGECYLTPRWAVDWLLERWVPVGSIICDPCACGFAGWSIGRHVADRFGAAVELSDIEPQHESVARADFRTLELSLIGGVWRDLNVPVLARTIITNPPYNLLAEFVRWGLEQAVEVVVLTRFGFLCAENGARAKHLQAYYQPAKRLAFELLPGEGERRLNHNFALDGLVTEMEMTAAQARVQRLDVHRDTSTLTGYRMSATGVDHGWAVYRRGWKGPANLVIESAEPKQATEEPPRVPQLSLFKHA